MPLDARDGRVVEVEGRDGGAGCAAVGGAAAADRAGGGSPLPEVPDGPDAVVGPGGEEVWCCARPAHDVHVGAAGLHAEFRRVALAARVPDFDGSVGGGGGEDVALGGRPL